VDQAISTQHNDKCAASPKLKAMKCLILIVEDEPELLLKFATAVQSDPLLELAGAVSTGKAGIALLDALQPAVLMVDLGLPDISGIEVIAHAAKHHPSTDVLVVTMFGDDQHVLASIEAGATGYLLKDALADRICISIHELRAGGSPITPSIARRVLARFRVAVPQPTPVLAAHTTSAIQMTGESALTDREVEILRLVAKGLSFNEVGETFGISPHTVVSHVKKIYRKLAVHSRGEAVFEAGQMGLL
jgi:DNA-binding NarL/FixJ family response regulator